MQRVPRFILFLLIFCARQVRAQEPILRHYTVNDGLPSNTIYDLFQDSQGFMWFCTDQGVSRFDGQKFQNFSTQDGLPDNEILAIGEDDYGRCWLVCYNGQPCYIERGRVRTSSNDRLCAQTEKSGINYSCFIRDRARNFCLAGNRVGTVEKSRIAIADDGPVFPAKFEFHFAYKDADYFLCRMGLVKSTNGKSQLHRITSDGKYYSGVFKDGHLYAYENRNNQFSLIDLLITNDIKTLKSTNLPGPIYGLHLTDSGIAWYAANVQTELNTTNHNITIKAIPINATITKRLVDNEDNNWFATGGNGVFFEGRNAPMKISLGDIKESKINSIRKTNTGELIACMDNGRFALLGKGRIRHFKLGNYENSVQYADPLDRHNFLICTNYGVYKYNISHDEARLLSNDAVKAIEKIGDDYLIGTATMFARYQYRSDTWIRLADSRTTAIAADSSGRIWFGGNRGIQYIENGRVYKLDLNEKLSTSRINSITILEKNTVLIATHKNGLFIYSRDRVINISSNNGLTSDNCKKVVVENEKTVWICTDKGVDRITIEEKGNINLQRISAESGFPQGVINDINFWGDSIFLAGVDGLAMLQRNFSPSVDPPRTYIQAVRQNGQELYSDGSQIMFTNGQPAIEISYTGISFSKSNNLNFRYTIVGLDNDTIQTRARTLILNLLKPGEYKLMIWSRIGGRGIWSLHPAILSFKIPGAWWQNPVLQIGIFISSLIALYVLYKSKIIKIKTGESNLYFKKQQLAALELESLRSQMNPHFVFNALSAIKQYYNEHSLEDGNKYLNTFSRLMRRVLHQSTTQWTSLAAEVELLNTYVELESMRFKHCFQYKIDVDPRIDLKNSSVPSMLIQPYVENAINHGLRHLKAQPGFLQILFYLNDNHIVCVIDDNGIGLNASIKLKNDAHQSFGLNLNKERITFLNSINKIKINFDIIDKSCFDNNLHGTLVTLTFPILTKESNDSFHN